MEELFTRNVKIGGSAQEVTFYQPGMSQMMKIQEEQPEWMEAMDEPVPEEQLDEEDIRAMIEYARLIVDSTTDIDSATVEKMDRSALANLTGYCKYAVRGDSPSDEKSVSYDIENPLGDIETNDNGRVDLEDVR